MEVEVLSGQIMKYTATEGKLSPLILVWLSLLQEKKIWTVHETAC